MTKEDGVIPAQLVSFVITVQLVFVIPAQAGIQGFCQTRWIPGSACGGPGMTNQGLLKVRSTQVHLLGKKAPACAGAEVTPLWKLALR